MTPTHGSVMARGPTAGDPSSARSLHHATVVTPEGVVLDFRAAGVGSRMLAIGIDLVIQFVAVIGGIFFAAFLAAAISGAAGVIAILLLLFAVLYGYPIGMETLWDGRTVGKRILGIKVLTTEGGPVALRHAVIRALIGTIDFWLPAPGGLVALGLALTTKRSQRLGDLAAGTIVVREPRSNPTSVFFRPAAGAEAFGLTVDAAGLEPEHYALVREFLMRSGELLPTPRIELAQQLADGVAAASGTPRPPQLDPERYLISMLFANQQRYGGAALGSLPPPTGSPVPLAPPPGQVRGGVGSL